MSAVCRNCQKPIQQGAKFCGFCGAPISQEDQVAISPAVEFQQYQNLGFDKPDYYGSHQEIDPRELKSILRDLEQGKGKNFEYAVKRLKEKRPIQAIEPLWKMKDKIFIKEDVENAIYEILAEIGSDELVNLIISENIYTNDKAKAMTYMVLGHELSPRSVEWLAHKSSFEDSPFDIIAVEILRRIGSKDAMIQLAKSANANYVDDSPPIIGRSLLTNVVISGVDYYKQSSVRDYAATLLTAPFLPVEILTSAPKIVQKSQTHIYRAQAIAELIHKHGENEIENFYNREFLESGSVWDKTSCESCLASAMLLAGKSPKFINTAITNVIDRTHKNYFGDKISAAVLTYCLIQYSKEKNTNIFNNSIMSAINDKDNIVSQSAMASALYADYRPIVSSILPKITIKDARFIPALAYSAYLHDNVEAKDLFNQFETKGNKEIKKATTNWREIIFEWKKT